DAVVFFTPEELPQLTATAKAAFPRHYGFMMSEILAGLRWGEAAALRKTDIDWKRARIHVQRTVSDRNRIEDCKDHESRFVDLSPALAAILRAQIETVNLDAQHGEWSPEQRELVFPNTIGGLRQHAHMLTEFWQPLLAKAGLPYRKMHATRHTFAS